MNKRGEQLSILSQDSFLSLIPRCLFQGLSNLHLICRSLQTPCIIKYQKNEEQALRRIWPKTSLQINHLKKNPEHNFKVKSKQTGDKRLRDKSGNSVALGHTELATIEISVMKLLWLCFEIKFEITEVLIYYGDYNNIAIQRTVFMRTILVMENVK